MKHLVEALQLNQQTLNHLFAKADEFRKGDHTDRLKNKILATLFYEKSTRTRLSFESAMLRLGGNVISVADASQSSVAKGESLEDTIRVISGYSDLIVIRSKEVGSAKRAAEVSSVPIINAGDGKGEHPSQALLDAYTIQREIGRLNDLNIVLCGDLKYGRTVRSLALLLSNLSRNHFTFVSSDELRMDKDVRDYADKNSLSLIEDTELRCFLSSADIVYMTRNQDERSKNGESNKILNSIDEKNLQLVSENARIMHPLPKRGEIDLPRKVEQTDKRIAYFRQAENGLYVRMALIDHLLNES